MLISRKANHAAHDWLSSILAYFCTGSSRIGKAHDSLYLLIIGNLLSRPNARGVIFTPGGA